MSSTDLNILLVVLAVVGVLVLAMLAIQVFVCWLLYDAWRRIPPQVVEGEPWHAWLLLVPFVNLVMPFFVHPRISRSYQRYLTACNIQGEGDCGEQMGFIYALCGVGSLIPYIGLLAALGGLCVLIVYVVKVNTLKKRYFPGAY